MYGNLDLITFFTVVGLYDCSFAGFYQDVRMSAIRNESGMRPTDNRQSTKHKQRITGKKGKSLLTSTANERSVEVRRTGQRTNQRA